jgi:hypothetical protein
MPTIRRAGMIAAALLTLGALAGCTSNPVAAVPTTAAPTAAASTPVATPTTPPPTQVAADAKPVSIKCHTLVPTAVVQQLDAAFTSVKGWTPAAGTPSARLSDLNGTTCTWTTAAGDLLEVSVAKPSVKDSTALKDDLVVRSQSVPTYGGEAYFQIVDHVGQADVFRGRSWLFVRSNRFFEPGDASAIVSAALTALGYGKQATPSPTPSDAASTPAVTATPAAG